MDPEIFDTIIIGGGAAGITACIYAVRKNLKVLLLTKNIGGQTALSGDVENYPGFPEGVTGTDISMRMEEQAKKYGAEIQYEEVGSIAKVGSEFQIKTARAAYQAKTVIIASGASFRTLGAPGERKLTGRGVSYCATCDAPFYKNKIAVVVGGGNSAVDAAVLLAKYAKKVYIVNHKNKFKAEELRTRQLKEFAHLEIILDSDLKEITGEEKVSGVTIKNLVNEEEKEIEADGVFIEIGHIVESDFISSLVKLDERKQIIVDSKNQTNFPGVFAAGDATTVPYKQIVIAAGEGAKAALSAYGYLQKKSIGE